MFVHIGLGKTGTTLLQTKIFPVCHKLGLIDYRTDLRATVKDALREFEISGNLPEKLHIQ